MLCLWNLFLTIWKCWRFLGRGKAIQVSVPTRDFFTDTTVVSLVQERPLLLSRQGTVRHTPVQYDVSTAWYNYKRRNVTKSERYNNGTVHDFSLWRNAKCSVQWCVIHSIGFSDVSQDRLAHAHATAWKTGSLIVLSPPTIHKMKMPNVYWEQVIAGQSSVKDIKVEFLIMLEQASETIFFFKNF